MNSERTPRGAAFTLIEVLVVLGIVCLLAALLLPALKSARSEARIAQCRNNLRQIGMAIQMYCQPTDGVIPAVTTYPTSKIWDDASGTPDSLGVLVTQNCLTDTGALFCPLNPENAPQVEANKIGQPPGQAGSDGYSSYLYRQNCIGKGTFHLDSLGRNPAGNVMRALALDADCPSYPNEVQIAHGGFSVNILFHDGSVVTADNLLKKYSIMNISFYPLDANGLPPVMEELQKVFVNADAAYAQ